MEYDFEETFFDPWVGENYECGYNGIKILVIGNSHYCSERCNCSYCGVAGDFYDKYDYCVDTTDIVSQFLDPDYYENWMKTYHNFECALTGYEVDSEVSNEIWNSIAFYNYLQTAVTGPYDKGRAKDYYSSRDAFWEVLEELRPDCIIFWGTRAWYKAPDFNGENYNCYALEDGTEISTLQIHHPSQGFNKYLAHKQIQNFLDSNF